MLKDICVALDITQQIGVGDLEVFKYKPARIRVVIKVDKTGQRDDSNQIRRVSPLTDSDGETREAKRSAQTTQATKPAVKPAPSPTKLAGNGPGPALWKKGQSHVA